MPGEKSQKLCVEEVRARRLVLGGRACCPIAVTTVSLAEKQGQYYGDGQQDVDGNHKKVNSHHCSPIKRGVLLSVFSVTGLLFSSTIVS